MRMTKTLFAVAATYAISSLATASATSDFTDEYAPANWSFYTDSSGTGTLDQFEMHVVGIDDGAVGYTEYYITALVTATLTFDWEFSTNDPTGSEFAFFGLEFVEHTFADTNGQSGTMSVLVYESDVFELGVYTTNGTDGAGELLISNFQFPEPSSLALLIAGVVLLRRR